LRYDTQRVPLCDVTAPPFDVVAPSEREWLAEHHPFNVVRVDVPLESDGEQRFTEAAAQLRSWMMEGILVRDPQPSFTIYRMRFDDHAGRSRTVSGVVGALEVCPPGRGDVLPHERTQSDLRTDRLELLRTTGANLSPIWGLSMTAGLSASLIAPGEPVGTCTDAAGVDHIVERVFDHARVATIRELVSATPVVLADGHHRYETARIHRAERHAAESGPGPWDLIMAFVSELAPGHLAIAAIHRLLTGAPSLEHLLSILEPWFHTKPVGVVSPEILDTMDDLGALCLVMPDHTGTLLLPRADRQEGMADLDSLRLTRALDGHDIQVSYQHGVVEVLEALDTGRAEAAVLIRPVPISEIQRVATHRSLMPPKSTFFTPKLRTGLVFRTFDAAP
jgi:uncharacterized protein (DUF1015 family)